MLSQLPLTARKCILHPSQSEFAKLLILRYHPEFFPIFMTSQAPLARLCELCKVTTRGAERNCQWTCRKGSLCSSSFSGIQGNVTESPALDLDCAHFHLRPELSRPRELLRFLERLLSQETRMLLGRVNTHSLLRLPFFLRLQLPNDLGCAWGMEVGNREERDME